MFTAKPAFQSNKESNEAGFYIGNKTTSTMYCNTNCSNKAATNNYQQLYALRNARFIKKRICRPGFGNKDLNINLFTKLDLQNVCAVNSMTTGTCASSINPSSVFFLNYAVDPNGALFGNTECGLNDYEHFLVPNFPSTYNK